MYTQDFEVIKQALAWCEAGEAAWLCTIVAATGSSPRPVGSLLAVQPGGVQVGSLSGGCVEEDLLARLASGEFNDHQCHTIEYGVSAEENERVVADLLTVHPEADLVPLAVAAPRQLPGVTRTGGRDLDERLARSVRVLPDDLWDGFYLCGITRRAA